MTPIEVHALALAAGLSTDSAVIATAIAWAESGLNPAAVGDVDLEDETWGPSVGLWQIRSLRALTATGKERDIERLGCPAFNARAMATISKDGTDWTPWSVYKSGRYLHHLEAVRAAVKEMPMPSPVQIIEAAILDLDAAGYKVTVVDGWSTRARPGSFTPAGLVCHHTATSRHAAGDYPSLRLVTDGRSDLAGPLAQFGLGRSGRIYVIAAGKANHAGGGGWNALEGNASVWGIEAENDGIGEPWPSAQIDAYLALTTALARHTGFSADDICGHREWTPYKIDPTGIDMDWFRAQVAERLADDPDPEPAPPPASQEETSLFIFDGPDGGIFYTDGVTYKRGVPNGDALEPWRQGKAHHLGTITRDYFDALPDWRPPGSLGLVDVEPLAGPLADYEPGPLDCASEA